MKTFDKYAAQGDVMMLKVQSVPEGFEKQDATGPHTVAHSETGHNHVMDSKNVDMYTAANDPLVMYLVVNKPSDLIHNRSFDTHETIHFDKGVYEVRRQREYTPEGWRRAAD